jgi:putative transposase
LVAFCRVVFDVTVEIVTRREGSVGFEVRHRRWVVERTFGWPGRWGRLNRNSEHTPASGKAVGQVALIGIVTRRLAKTNRK